MSKLIYGKKGQISFKNEQEKKEAFDYIMNSDNVNFKIHEDNQIHGAWAPEDRIHFRSEEGVPESLKRQMTAGRGRLYGRINCKELCEELRSMKK